MQTAGDPQALADFPSIYPKAELAKFEVDSNLRRYRTTLRGQPTAQLLQQPSGVRKILPDHAIDVPCCDDRPVGIGRVKT
jgi:hypothetical protein